MELSFKGKVAFVTGAASGIGRATAIAFAEAGASVAVLDVNSDGGQETVAMIQRKDGKAVFFHCDVANEKSVREAIDKTVERLGGLDIAFNNAGIEGQLNVTEECTNENWNRVLQTNLTGVWYCMKHQIPILKQNKAGGAIVNCASIAGLIGFPLIPAYAASKHAVVGLTKTAALELATKNVRVNCVCPGVIETPMIDRFTSEKVSKSDLMRSEPVGRMGTPEEIANGVLWLSSPAASFVTGHTLVIDGGWVAQ